MQKSFGGKIVCGKKSLRFWIVFSVDPKIYQVFWREKSCSMLKIFSHQKYIFCFTPDAVQIRRFFFLSTTLHAQKKVKEIAYILTCYQALLPSAILFFLLFVNVIKIKGKDNIMEMKFLFVFIFTYWIQFLSNK